MRFKKTFIIFLICLILLNLSIVYSTIKNNNNTANFFRIHVVANSDSIDDQLLKYKIAKQLDEYISTLTVNSNSKEESKEVIEENIQNILTLCNTIVTKEGYNYALKAYIGKLEYGEKQKDETYMNPGIYDSLKIVIGNGKGQNWWSLIYPTNIEYTITDETYNNDVEYKLYFLEWFKELFKNQL